MCSRRLVRPSLFLDPHSSLSLCPSMVFLGLAFFCFLGLSLTCFFLPSLTFFPLFLLGVFLPLSLPLFGFTLLALCLSLSLFLLLYPSLLISLLSQPLVFCGFSVGFSLLALFFFSLPLLLLFLLFCLANCGFLSGLLALSFRFFFVLGMLLGFLLLLLLGSFSSFLGFTLGIKTVFLLKLLEQFRLSFGGDFLSIGGQNTLFEHSGSKDLEHASTFLHSLIFRHGVLRSLA